MPRNGEVNRVFGVYKNVCCGGEIVIPENVIFPGCPLHANFPTRWLNVTTAEHIPHVSELISTREGGNRENPAA
jgi:hypothetical protein